MKSTRKWIAAIMAVLMLVLMAACGNGGKRYEYDILKTFLLMGRSF